MIEMQGKELREAFAHNIKAWRQFRKMTQVDLAKAVGITQAHVSDIEKEKTFPSPEVIAALADTLGVTPSGLLNSEKILANSH